VAISTVFLGLLTIAIGYSLYKLEIALNTNFKKNANFKLYGNGFSISSLDFLLHLLGKPCQ
jgi:hypothetical protein